MENPQRLPQNMYVRINLHPSTPRTMVNKKPAYINNNFCCAIDEKKDQPTKLNTEKKKIKMKKTEKNEKKQNKQVSV